VSLPNDGTAGAAALGGGHGLYASLSALRQVSLDQNVSPPAHERVALNAAFLLEEARSREFDDVLEAIAYE